MTYEEKIKVAEAANLIKENCDKCYSYETDCEDCIFDVNGCLLNFHGIPRYWKIPTITRWTPEDVALAKALKAVGAHGFYKNMVKGDVFWMDGKGNSAKLPKGCLTALENGTEILIDTIIKEAEG